MRKRFIYSVSFLCVAFLLFSLSCNEKNLDIEPSFTTEDAYFSNETEFNRAVLGIYSKLSDYYWYMGNGSVHPMQLLPGDDITANDQEEFEQFGQLQPSSGRVSYFYRTSYQLNARANAVIEKVENVADGIYTTAGLKENHLGEAHFLRGFANWMLWNYFGTAPLVTERVTTTDQTTPPNSTGTQLLDQAIIDFETAVPLLPDEWDPANRGRVTKNSARGMLGKALVFRATVNGAVADYTAAIAAFNAITGVTLVPKFDDNVAADTENNAESLFEFQASQAFAVDNVWLDNDFDNAVGSISAFWGYYDNNFALFGKSRFYATTKLLNAFDPTDPRLELTMNPSDRTVRKYVLRDQLVNSGVGSANNPRILRYADVLLLKAEAILFSGGSKAEAIGLINQVRKRARDMTGSAAPADFNTGETSEAVIFNWIVEERFRELAGEGQRWIDLRRWALANKITLNNAFFSSNTNTMAFQSPKHLNFPIPTSELDVNPNVTQNPGY